MAYSYDRTASVKTASSNDLRDLSPKFYQALKQAISRETNREAKATLQDALDKFEDVIDLLKVAQHESEESVREASFDVNKRVVALNLRGRDDFYTHLIQQERIMWTPMVLRGEESRIAEEVDWLVKRRGFNAHEAAELRRLANFFVSNAEAIRRGTSRSYQ